MTLESLRDPSIGLFAWVTIGVSVFVAVLTYNICRETKVTMDAVKTASKTVEDAFVAVEQELVIPVIRVATLVQMVVDWARRIGRAFANHDEEGRANE